MEQGLQYCNTFFDASILFLKPFEAPFSVAFCSQVKGTSLVPCVVFLGDFRSWILSQNHSLRLRCEPHILPILMWGRNGDSNGRARLISEFLYHSFYSFLNTSVLRETIVTICFRFFNLYVDGSIPINTIFSWLFTSINSSYFDVNKKGVQGFDTLPYVYLNSRGMGLHL